MRKVYFPELYGNLPTRERIGSVIKNGTLPHAFLILGPQGSGKHTLAVQMAMALSCEMRTSAELPLPCGICRTCRRIKEGNYTDLTLLGRRDGKATIGVEEVRELREDAHLSPTEASYKVYVIEDAHRLTQNAQNALLTLLEEPPKNVIILLLAEEGDKILTTIKSRAQSVAMQKFSSDELKDYLTKHNDTARLYSKTDDSTLLEIIMSADGRIGKAMQLLSGGKDAAEILDERKTVEQLIAALSPQASYAELYSALSRLPTPRIEFTECIEASISALRDLIASKFDKEYHTLFYTSTADAAAAARDLSTKRLLQIYELLKVALDDAAKNVSTAVICTELGAKIRLT